MRGIICVICFLYLSLSSLYSQESIDTVGISFKPYTSLRGQVAVFDKQMELQENASRIGTELNIKKGKIEFIAGLELQVNLFRGSTSFSADASLSEGFINIQTTQTQQVLGNRLGYLGFSIEKYGVITIGKQWSVYRDISSYTDRFNVFGARASATFVGGTDGGASGTGRADQSVIYRNKIGPLYFGAQIQARGSNNDQFIDGLGFSTQLKIAQDFFVGMAFNRAFLNEKTINNGQILGLSGNPTYITFGTKYIGNKIDFSVIYAMQKNGDFTQGLYLDSELNIMKPTVVFDAKGIEVFGKYKFNKLSILIGYNLYVPAEGRISKVFDQSIIDHRFKRNDFITGLSYMPIKYIQFYSEQRVSFGKNSIGEKEKSVFTLGMKIDLSKSFNKAVLL